MQTVCTVPICNFCNFCSSYSICYHQFLFTGWLYICYRFACDIAFLLSALCNSIFYHILFIPFFSLSLLNTASATGLFMIVGFVQNLFSLLFYLLNAWLFISLLRTKKCFSCNCNNTWKPSESRSRFKQKTWKFSV